MVMYDIYNSEKIEKWLMQYNIYITKQYGMKSYLWVGLIMDINGTYLRKGLYIML